MSSILKALRKLEEEKARRQGGSPDIARDILRHSPRRSPRGNAWLFGAATVLLVLGAGAFFWLVSGSTGPSRTTLMAAAEPVLAEPVLAEPVVAEPVVAEPVVAEPVAAEPVAVDRPSLVLSGIAYQETPDGRLAVVNDLPVMEGTVIEGARVEEIQRDRVRFSVGGGVFEVALEDAGRH